MNPTSEPLSIHEILYTDLLPPVILHIRIRPCQNSTLQVSARKRSRSRWQCDGYSDKSSLRMPGQ